MRVGPRFLSGGDAVMDMPPVIGGDRTGIETEALDLVDHLQNMLHLRPARHVEQQVAAGPDKGRGLKGGAPFHGAYDGEAGDDRAVIIGGPADKTERAAGRETQQAAAFVEHAVGDRPAKPDPVFDALFDEGQFDRGQVGIIRSHDLFLREGISRRAAA